MTHKFADGTLVRCIKMKDELRGIGIFIKKFPSKFKIEQFGVWTGDKHIGEPRYLIKDKINFTGGYVIPESFLEAVENIDGDLNTPPFDK